LVAGISGHSAQTVQSTHGSRFWLIIDDKSLLHSKCREEKAHAGAVALISPTWRQIAILVIDAHLRFVVP
jgi:hypothetical protein